MIDIKIVLLVVLYICISYGNVFAEQNSEDLVYVSVPPLEYFVEMISQHRVEVESLVSSGDNADAYNPTPKQMYALSRAKAFIGIGLPYETRVRTRLKSYASLHVAIIGTAISRIPYDESDDHNDEDNEHDNVMGDPHIWMSVENVYVLVKDVHDVLRELYPHYSQVFEDGLEMMVRKIDEVRATVTEALTPVRGSTFLIYHPVLGYFAKEQGLHQLSIQWKGQERSVQQIREIVRLSNERNVSVVLIQKGFPDSAANTIAEQIRAPVYTIDPLMKDWSENMLAITSLFQMRIE